jgi:hypothetical protein
MSLPSAVAIRFKTTIEGLRLPFHPAQIGLMDVSLMGELFLSEPFSFPQPS